MNEPADINDAFDDESTEDESTEMVENTAPTAEGDNSQESKEDSKEGSEPESSKSEDENKEDDKKESKDETSVPLKALLTERQKRQELENKIRQYEQAKNPPLEAPDPAQDPEGYKAFTKEQIEAEILNNRINTSREIMLGDKVDYEERERVYNYLEAKTPELRQQLLNHPDPARFAYETAVKYEVDYRSKIEKDILASAKGNVVKEDSNTDTKKSLAVMAPDLTGATAMGKNTQSLIVDNPNDVNDIFRDSPF